MHLSLVQEEDERRRQYLEWQQYGEEEKRRYAILALPRDLEEKERKWKYVEDPIQSVLLREEEGMIGRERVQLLQAKEQEGKYLHELYLSQMWAQHH